MLPKRKSCRFLDNNKCILNYKNCYPCSSKIKRIEGIDTVSEYLSFVTNRKNNRLILWFTFLSLLISMSALFTSIFEDEIKEYLKNKQLPTTYKSNGEEDNSLQPNDSINKTVFDKNSN